MGIETFVLWDFHLSNILFLILGTCPSRFLTRLSQFHQLYQRPKKRPWHIVVAGKKGSFYDTGQRSRLCKSLGTHFGKQWEGKGRPLDFVLIFLNGWKGS